MIKKFPISLMAIVLLIVLLCGVAQATEFQTRGSAVVTGMDSRYIHSTAREESNFWITNIAGSTVTCRVTFYDHDGNDITSYCSIYSGNNSNGSSVLIASGTGTFTLPAAATRYVQLSVGTASKCIRGHAVIEWTSEDTSIRKALIAQGRRNRIEGDRSEAISISVNNGQAF